MMLNQILCLVSVISHVLYMENWEIILVICVLACCSGCNHMKLPKFVPYLACNPAHRAPSAANS